MPLGEFTDKDGKQVSNFGSQEDGTQSSDYCSLCFQRGSFTQPNLSLQDMIALSIENMTGELKMPEEKARQLANTAIPKLKRWQKPAQ